MELSPVLVKEILNLPKEPVSVRINNNFVHYNFGGGSLGYDVPICSFSLKAKIWAVKKRRTSIQSWVATPDGENMIAYCLFTGAPESFPSDSEPTSTLLAVNWIFKNIKDLG